MARCNQGRLHWSAFFLLAFGWLAEFPVHVHPQQDMTIQEYARGKEVVVATVNSIKESCLFHDDWLLIRRLAYALTQDGVHLKTFRPGYYGGIWQIDKSKFISTKTQSVWTQEYIGLIQSVFGIDWYTVEWQKLVIPLYSGLAAGLYIVKTQQGNGFPSTLSAQAQFYASQFQPSGSQKNFTSLVSQLLQGCMHQRTDLTFVIDSSGSISKKDFQRTLEFLRTVIIGLQVSREHVQVSIVKFSSSATVEFGLNTHKTQADVLNAVSQIAYHSGGTSTGLAINVTYQNIFQEVNGARKTASKVVVLVTDGHSNSLSNTIYAASLAKKAGLIFFAIGVGNVNKDELKHIASEPNCTHVYLLSTFTEIDNLLYEIKKSSCDAPVVIESDNTVQMFSNVLNQNETEVNIKVPDKGGNSTKKTILVSVQCGEVFVYLSYDTTHPGPALYDLFGKATDKNPLVLKTDGSSKRSTLFITINSRKLIMIDDLKQCKNASYHMSIHQGNTEPLVVEPNPNNSRVLNGVLGSKRTKLTFEVSGRKESDINGQTIFAKIQCGELDVYASYHTNDPGPNNHDVFGKATHGEPLVLSTTASKENHKLYVSIIGKTKSNFQNLKNCKNSNYTLSFHEEEETEPLVVEPNPNNSRVLNGVLGSKRTKLTFEVSGRKESDINGQTIFAKIQCGELDVYASYHTNDPGPNNHDVFGKATHGEPLVLSTTASKENHKLYVSIIGKTKGNFQNLKNCKNSNYTLSFHEEEETDPLLKQNYYGHITSTSTSIQKFLPLLSCFPALIVAVQLQR